MRVSSFYTGDYKGDMRAVYKAIEGHIRALAGLDLVSYKGL